MKYRKKPVEVEAIQFFNGDGINHTIAECVKFCKNSKVELKEDFYEGDIGLIIPTLEGKMRVNNGDWIIKGIAGEFYPCKPDIFEKTYEEVKEDY